MPVSSRVQQQCLHSSSNVDAAPAFRLPHPNRILQPHILRPQHPLQAATFVISVSFYFYLAVALSSWTWTVFLTLRVTCLSDGSAFDPVADVCYTRLNKTVALRYRVGRALTSQSVPMRSACGSCKVLVRHRIGIPNLTCFSTQILKKHVHRAI